MSQPKLHQCPYEEASKCSLMESCMGCETLAQHIREHGINGHPIPYIWVLPARALGELDRDFIERVKEYIKLTHTQESTCTNKP